jgi:pimeloyl-ACP methyl ester carboxylesterase
MPLLDTPSGPIAYDERGDGPAIVLLPSGAHDRHDYDELRALLPGGLRTIALDWPGHGGSPLGQGPATAMRFADVAEELVARLAPDGAIVVGNSVGGFAAARLAARRPELVRGLVVVDGGGFGSRPLHVRAFCALMARPWFLRRIYPAFSARYMRARTDADRRVRAVGVATTRADPGLRAVAELWRSFASPEHDLREEARAITAPTLVLWGKRDPVIPLKLGRRVAALIPGARLVVFDTGHVPHTSDPEGVAAELLPFALAAHHLDSMAHGQGQEAQGGTG